MTIIIQTLSLSAKFPIKCIMNLIESHLNQYFGIPSSQIIEWRNASAQESESLILWILKNKKVDTKKYEDWSFKYYKIPRLKMNYFKKHPLDQSLLTQYHITWPDHVFPLKKWKGVLYLACLEPVKEINISEELQWVLAPIEGILSWKAKIQTTASNVSNDAHPTTNFKSIDFGSIHLSSSEKPVEKTASPTQAPTTPPKKDMKDFTFDKMSVPPPRTEELEKTKHTATEKLSENQINTVSLSLFKKKKSNQTHHPLNSPTDTSKASSHNNIPTSLKTTSIHKPIPSALPKEQKQPLPVIKINSKPNALQISKIHHNEGTMKQDHLAQEDIYDVILNRLSVMFDQSMILMFKNSILKPKKWDSSWVKDPSTHNVILLNKPSVFQIVYKTKQKYHGYVAPCAVNDIFFKTWNMGRYPEHLTLLPLIKRNTTAVTGMLLGATSKEKGDSLLLDKLDILALEASQKLLK